MPKKLKVGDSVFGLWPGSGGLYFKGVIVEASPKDGTYDVKFEEGTTYTLLERHVKPVESFKAIEPKSAQRQVLRRARSSSGSRSRSRSRTPSRNPRSVKKASPSSKKESPLNDEKPLTTEPERQVSARKKLIDDEEVELKTNTSEDVTEDIPLRRSIRLRSPMQKDTPEYAFKRRSTRLAEKIKKEEPLDANGLVESAKPSEKEKESESSASPAKDATDDDESTSKFGALSTTLLTIFYVSLVFYLYIIYLIDLYNPFVSLCVEGFYLLVLLLSMLPFGQPYQIEGAQGSRRNGNLVSAFTLTIFLALKYYFKISASVILQQVPQFLFPTFIVGLVAAVFVAYNSRADRNETGLLRHFVAGSSVQVSLGGVNVKIWIYRSLFLALFILNSLAIEARLQKGETFSRTLALTAGMQIIFAAEAILTEKSFLASLEFNETKIGWMYLTMLAYPFTTFFATLSVSASGHELPAYYIVPIGILFILGMWIKVASNAQKEAFSDDPKNPIFTNMESLTAATGEKLLISGWWGCLRHPNYLGDVLIHCAFALPCGTHIFLPHLISLCITLNLFYRAAKKDAAAKLKYGPAWDRYCQRVPSRVIPRIF